MALFLAGAAVERYQLVDSFGDFLVGNGVLSVSTGIVVGAATLYWVRGAVNDVFMPLLDVMLLGIVRLVHKRTANAISSWLFSNTKFQIARFVRETMTLAITLLAAFAVIHYGYKHFVNRNKKEKEKKRTAEDSTYATRPRLE